MPDWLTLDDVPVRGKTVLMRFDINSPIEHGRIAGTERLEDAARSLKEVAARGSKVVALGHQGRKGGEDFASLREHASLLGRFAGVEVGFVDEVVGPKASQAIHGLRDGQALMLENVRGLDDETKKAKPEEHARAAFIQALAKEAQVYICDAFSAAHRAQASLVGLPLLLPSIAGPGMARELIALDKATSNPEPPSVYVLGGAKPEDSIAVMEHNFGTGKLDTALLTGLVGELFLVARGNELGKPTMELLERRKILDLQPAAEKLLDEHDDGIVTPIDVAVKTREGRQEVWVEDLPAEGPVLDIGKETLADFALTLADAGSIFFNGPAGLYEEPPYDLGTRGLLEAVKDSPAFSLIGGGHTTASLAKFGLREQDFGHVSLAGGALLAYITGEPLPAVEALKASAAKFKGRL